MSLSSKLKLSEVTAESAAYANGTESLSVSTYYQNSISSGKVGIAQLGLGQLSNYDIDLAGSGAGDADLHGYQSKVIAFVTVYRIVIEITAGDKVLQISGSDDFDMVAGTLAAGSKKIIVIDDPEGYTIDATHKLLNFVTAAGGSENVVVKITIIGAEA